MPQPLAFSWKTLGKKSKTSWRLSRHFPWGWGWGWGVVSPILRWNLRTGSFYPDSRVRDTNPWRAGVSQERPEKRENQVCIRQDWRGSPRTTTDASRIRNQLEVVRTHVFFFFFPIQGSKKEWGDSDDNFGELHNMINKATVYYLLFSLQALQHTDTQPAWTPEDLMKSISTEQFSL